MQQTLEQYLREMFFRGYIDHRIRAQVHADGAVTFYIHTMNTNSDTLDFEVRMNDLVENPRVTRRAND